MAKPKAKSDTAPVETESPNIEAPQAEAKAVATPSAPPVGKPDAAPGSYTKSPSALLRAAKSGNPEGFLGKAKK